MHARRLTASIYYLSMPKITLKKPVCLSRLSQLSNRPVQAGPPISGISSNKLRNDRYWVGSGLYSEPAGRHHRSGPEGLCKVRFGCQT